MEEFCENWMKIEDFLKNSQNWPLGCAPRGMEQKIYQKVISYTNKVLLSKFGKNWRRNEDFMKNAKICPLGGTPGGAGQKFYQKAISYAEMFLLSKFDENQLSAPSPTLIIQGRVENGDIFSGKWGLFLWVEPFY